MEYDDEVFARIEGYENYAISNYARVLNIRRQRFLKPWLSKIGYLQVSLNSTKFYIHRLIAKAFINKDCNEANKFVDHIDRNRLNNSIINLRWVNMSENASNRTKKTNIASS